MYSSTLTPRAEVTKNTLRFLRHITASKPSPLRWCRFTTSKSQTHYDLFPTTLPSGPPPTGQFSIDKRRLRKEFLQLQAQAHPDLHPPERKTRAEAQSSRINEAYKTLSDPLLRAQYLLSLHYGTDVSSDEAAKLDGGDGTSDAEDAALLMLVMEARETIEDADSDEQLLEVNKENEERIEQTIHLLEKAFDEGDWNSAKRETVRLRYWVGIGESLKNWERRG